MQILGINNYYQPKYQQRQTNNIKSLQTQPTFSGGMMQVRGFKDISKFKNIDNPLNKAFFEELKTKMSKLPEPNNDRTYWGMPSLCLNKTIVDLYNSCLDSNGIVNALAASVMFQMANIPDGKLNSWNLPDWYSKRNKEKSESYYTSGIDGLVEGLNIAKDNKGNHNEDNLKALLYLDKEYKYNLAGSDFSDMFSNLKNKDGVIEPLFFEHFKKLSKMSGFVYIDNKIGDIFRFPQSGQEFVSSVEQNCRKSGLILLSYILLDADEEKYDEIFKVLNETVDFNELEKDYDFRSFSVFRPELIRFSYDKTEKINPTNLKKLLEFKQNNDEEIFDASEDLKDKDGVIRDENIDAYNKLREYIFNEPISETVRHSDFSNLNLYITDLKDENGIIKPEFVENFTRICAKYEISSNSYDMRNLIEIMDLIQNNKPTNWNAVETLYQYGKNYNMCWQMSRFDMIKDAVRFLWDENNNEISPEKLDLFRKNGGLSEKGVNVEDIKASIKLRSLLEKEDYGNLYMAGNMLELLRDLRDQGDFNAEILTLPIAENDGTLLMYIADIFPTEENAKKYDKIINILKNTDDINYNYKDEMGVSFLEKVIMSENFKLLELIKDEPLVYYPELEYTYQNIQNPEFKEGIKRLDFMLTEDNKQIGTSKKIEEKAKSIENEKPLLAAILRSQE